MAATSSLETLFNETNLSAAEIQARLAELSHPVSSFSAEIKQDILAKIRNISRWDGTFDVKLKFEILIELVIGRER